MKPRLIILFSLIVIIPMGTIIWLGISLSLRERTVVKEQFSQICLSNLNDIKQDITKKIESIEIQFNDSNKDTNLFNVSANKPKDPLINQLFILDTRRKLVYPNPLSKNLQECEVSFLKRTQEIWDSGEKFYRPEQYDYLSNNDLQRQVEFDNANGSIYQSVQLENISEEQQGQTLSQNKYNYSSQQQRQEPENPQIVIQGNRKQSYLSSINSQELVKPTTGWYSWFQGKGLNFILWKRNEMDQIIGYELNREKMIDSIIATLPESTSNYSQHFQLRNATSALHSWGSYEPPPGLMPIAEISLNAPLQSWKLLCFFNDSHLTMASARTILYNYVLGGAILGILILTLCIYFYRENSRQLRESSQKVNFVNQVSHELKTPLTNIRMYAELLERNLDEANAKSQKQLGVIVSESQRLSRLIANVLSFAQKDKNTLKLNFRTVEMSSFLNNIVSTYSPVLQRKKISIELEISASPTIKADSDALEQILGNLLSNVEKYVQEGGQVKIRCREESSQILTCVSDDGPGIPLKQREKIFESFHRVSNALSDGVSGTGIGLTISRDLARLHGGDLILLDTEVGASFQLSLPIDKTGK